MISVDALPSMQAGGGAAVTGDVSSFPSLDEVANLFKTAILEVA